MQVPEVQVNCSSLHAVNARVVGPDTKQPSPLRVQGERPIGYPDTAAVAPESTNLGFTGTWESFDTWGYPPPTESPPSVGASQKAQ